MTHDMLSKDNACSRASLMYPDGCTKTNEPEFLRILHSLLMRSHLKTCAAIARGQPHA